MLAACPASAELARNLCLRYPSLNMVVAETGRARQMNAAVAELSTDWLWFLHVDSGLSLNHIRDVKQAMRQSQPCLCCFALAFRNDGPAFMAINAQAANLRTRWLGLPFGDQGFLLRRSDFLRVGGYNEQACWGEDHLLIWQLRCQNIAVQMLTSALPTSARRYRSSGWWRLTLLYQYRWLRQAAPWLLRRLRQKLAQHFPGNDSGFPP